MSDARYPAEFLDGWSLAAIRVEVELHPAGLRVLDEAGEERVLWPASALRCDAMQQGGVVHVTGSAGPETLVVRDPALLERVLALCNEVSALPGGRRTGRFVAIWLGALVALGAVAYLGAPLLAHAIAKRIPLEHERALGTQIETVLVFAACDNRKAEQALRDLERRLLRPSDLRDELFEVRLVHTPEPNAFALPGGVIVVTSGLIEQSDNPDEVAGVLAHEVEHVVQRHVLSGFIRDALLSGLWAVSVGDYSGLLAVDPTTAYRVANLKFSRADEEEADAGAVARLHAAGISHRGLIDFFERLREKNRVDGPAWLSTHPATEDRIERLKRERDVGDAKPALDAAQYQALKGGCAD
ncbi:MAG TPA: M48 family metallopeptidase [Polyangiales bacterium]|nr:M48 family metallopeptidase [Polyangiales bacterium]